MLSPFLWRAVAPVAHHNLRHVLMSALPTAWMLSPFFNSCRKCPHATVCLSSRGARRTRVTLPPSEPLLEPCCPCPYQHRPDRAPQKLGRPEIDDLQSAVPGSRSLS
uniref:Uncharacterized protein n=1 Tax=Mus musculus TaxID=10090 RepID=Q3TSM4_MOUSE|nr:unnamed protein product [Mus musculus]BAE43290.1 unnamed protein product [Mus musculus]